MSMRRAHAVHTDWPAEAEVSTVTLTFDARHRRRIVMTDDQGESFLLDLPNAVQLKDGDGLELEAGGFVRVCAALEPVAEVTCSSPAELARVAWHVGNRHTPVQVLDSGKLLVSDDHVLVEMLEGLGATVRRTEAPFQPEGGAYARGHSHGHGHSHSHGDDHAHGHSHGHAHNHSHGHAHSHSHAHDEDHGHHHH